MLTTSERLGKVRSYHDKNGRLLVSVTSAMALVKAILNEPPDFYGPPALARVHALEGTGAHSATLDYLAYKSGMIPSYEPPAWPKLHGDERRWHNVMHAAMTGFAEFIEQYEVETVAIEQEATSSALGLIGHIDLLATMKWNKQRVLAIADLKFVASIQESHRLQLRCYSRLDQMKGANIGILYHANRNTGKWKIEPVDLRANLKDVLAVSYAAQLWEWKESRHV